MTRTYRKQISTRLSILIIGVSVYSVLLSGCNENAKQTHRDTTQQTLRHDTLIGTKVITNELAGSVYRKRAKSYFLITNGDTSAFACSFLQAKSDGKISIDMRFRDDMTYRQQWVEVNKIIPFALDDFAVNPDSLQTVFIGRFITTGDLAIRVARQYHERFKNDHTISHAKVSAFLMQSDLVSEWNTVLQPYDVVVETVYTEKNFFASKEDVFYGSRIETDSLHIPEKILDCMTWIKLKHKRVVRS